MPASYGLIGYPLTHSFSPAYFADKFAKEQIDAVYDPYSLSSIEVFPTLLAAHELQGLNVTIPYKESVMPYLDGLDDIAAHVGAVNCISFKGGKKTGHNTDVIGFEQSLLPLLQEQHTQALILGSGGASKAVAYVLEKLGIPFTKVSRIKKDAIYTYEEVDEDIVAAHKLIINTTPIGMYPRIDDHPPIAYSSIGAGHLLYDLIYNPSETTFLSLGREQGAMTKNGHEMLVLQAEASWQIWNS